MTVRPRVDGVTRVVLLHGLTGSRRFFDGLEEALRAAPVGAQTLAFDLPGFGEHVHVPSDYTVAAQLRFISGQVEERFPFGPLVLVGHSLGGVLALAWAAQCPERVSRLILLNTPLGSSREDTVTSLLRGSPGWGRLLLRHPRLAHVSCAVFRHTRLVRLLRLARPWWVPEEILRDYAKHTWASLLGTFQHVLLDAPGGQLLARVRRVPVLHLVGREDDEICRRRVPQANVTTLELPGGHLMLLEHADMTIQAVRAGLASQEVRW